MKSIKEQRAGLLRLTENGKGFGILIIVSMPGDVLYAESPVPDLRGFEFVFASSESSYDIWKRDRLIHTGLSLEATQNFIRKRTPNWLYDDSELSTDQIQTVKQWTEALCLSLTS
jgi:hypothetical protein